MTDLSRSPRFLIVRLSALGDCVLSLPVACALRTKYPNAFIAWVAEPLGARLLKSHPCLDEVVVVPRGWWKSPRSVFDLRKKLRALAIDTALDVQSLTKSAMVAWLSGAKQRIGLARPWGRELSLLMNNVRVSPTRDHVVDAFLEMLQPLGIEAPAIEFGISEDATARERMEEFLQRELAGRRPAIIVPFATWHSKSWPIDRYGHVAAHLGRKHGLCSVVPWYGALERAAAEQVVAESEGHAVLAAETNLFDITSLARRAARFVGPDTGLLHLAAAVGTPCVGLYGPTRIERCGPYGKIHVPLQAYYQAGTRRQRRTADNLAMQAIDAAAVCRACDQALLFSTRRGLRYNSAVRQSS